MNTLRNLTNSGEHMNYLLDNGYTEDAKRLFESQFSEGDAYRRQGNKWNTDLLYRSFAWRAGFYVPASIQESHFFPELKNTNPEKPHIYDALIHTFWPASGELRESALKHYSNKGTEYHCTRIPKDQFADLSPASLLIGGLLRF